MLLLAAALGLLVRYRSAAREQLVARAGSRERSELARELHDTVAHHVSGIAVQAQAGLFVARSSSPSGATEALEVIDREAVTTARRHAHRAHRVEVSVTGSAADVRMTVRDDGAGVTAPNPLGFG